jgi:YihY family inner membrane protein
MSTATTVPETFELEGDDAQATLRHTGRGRLAKDAFKRFRAADGFSHSRALAYQITLLVFPALIALVAVTSLIDQETFRRIMERTILGLAPGPAGQLLTQAFQQGSSGQAGPALTAGLVGALASGMFAMAQIERGANRIYGIESDRPTLRKYGRAFLLAISSGLLSLLGFVLFVAGSVLGDAAKTTSGWSDTAETLWAIARWPLGILFVVAALALLFKMSPHRRQPAASWLAAGSIVSLVLWVAFTALLAYFLTASRSFGQTYGPLAGIVGLLLWAFLTSLAVYLGLAFAAQLEAVRARVPVPDERDAPHQAGART